MGFIGRLARDMPFTDLVQMLSMSKRTGKLTLTEGRLKASLVFRQGDIIAAMTDPPKVRLGDTLVKRGLITEAHIKMALDVQRSMDPPPVLGSILVEMGALSPLTLRDLVREHVELVLGDLVSWVNGSFRFDPMTPAEALERALEGKELAVPAGLRAEHVMFEAMRRRDEQARDLGRTNEDSAVPEPPPAHAEPLELPGPDGFSPAQVVDLLVQTQRRHTNGPTSLGATDLVVVLKSIMEEGRGARALPEVALLILRCAAAVVSRGMLLHIEGGFASCAGQFGVKLIEPTADRRAAAFRLPLSDPSVVTRVIESRCCFVGELGPGKANDALVELLGGGQPTECVVVPVVTNNDVQLVLYGDNLPDHTRVGGVEILEMLALYAGIELEKARLEGATCA